MTRPPKKPKPAIDERILEPAAVEELELTWKDPPGFWGFLGLSPPSEPPFRRGGRSSPAGDMGYQYWRMPPDPSLTSYPPFNPSRYRAGP